MWPIHDFVVGTNPDSRVITDIGFLFKLEEGYEIYIENSTPLNYLSIVSTRLNETRRSLLLIVSAR